MPRKLFIKTHGCQMNEYDSAKMGDVLRESHGLELTDDPAQADVLLLNTCSIREKAQEKVYSELGRWRELKLERPGLVIGVGGCVASQEGAALRERAPFVDVVFGPQTLHRLPALLAAADEHRGAVVDVSFPEIEKFDSLPEPRAEGPTAFVSVMEGCSKYCTFCVVPYTRGEEVSRRFDDVMTDLQPFETLDAWQYESEAAAFRRITAQVLLVGISSDWLFPAVEVKALSERMRQEGVRAAYAELESSHGHDGFLADAAALARLLRDALHGPAISPSSLHAQLP